MNPLALTVTIPLGILPDRAVLAQELRAAAQQLMALAAAKLDLARWRAAGAGA